MELEKFIKTKTENWQQLSVTLIDGLDFNTFENFKKIEFITNSKYLSGQRDRRGKLKPFYNITNFRVNIATRATDIDTRDIQIIADEPQFMALSFLLQKEVYNWMKEVNFGKTLNEMGYTRAKYGGVMIKKYEDEDGQLHLEIVDWRNVVCDPVDPTNYVIEKHYMSASDLYEKEGVWEDIEDAIEQAKKSKDERLEVLETYGCFEEDGDYVYKTYITYSEKKKIKILFEETHEDRKYKYLAWENVNGRLGRGVVEDGFEAQQWANDAVIKEKEAMELGSKVLFKSTDPNIQNNVLTDMENGQIIKITQGNDMSIVNTITNALPEFGNLIKSWDDQYERVSSTFNAISGETMPSGTPFRAIAIQNQESTAMFDYRREEMGIFLVEVFTEWVIPFLMKKFNKAHILAGEFSKEELEAIDESFANYRATEEAKNLILEGKPVYQDDYIAMVGVIKEIQSKNKETRFLDIPKGMYKNWIPKVTILTTGENKNKAVVLESLNNIIATVAQAPQILQDPVLSKIFGKILELSGSGISPISLGIGNQQPAQLPEQVAPNTQQPLTQTASQVAQA